jgi:DNA-binding NarL/FixJ family response regulator
VGEITILIIDEQPFYRVGLRQVLAEQSDFRIIDCELTDDPIVLIEANHPNVVLLGSDLTAFSGLELGRKIARYYPNTKVIMLSPNPSDVEILEVIESAATACLSKSIGVEELSRTIRRAYHGEYPINDSLTSRPLVASRVLKHFEDISSMGKTIEHLVAPLTRREREILNYVAGGNTNNQIGHILGISEQTIKSHVSAILRKLNANDRAHAVAIAMRNGWLTMERSLV